MSASLEWPRMRIELDDGSMYLFPEGPKCKRCGHHVCPFCPMAWCDQLTDEFDQCCDGACDVDPGQYDEWHRALFESAGPLDIVGTEGLGEDTPDV